MHERKLIPRNECSFKHRTIFACINTTTLFGYFCKKLAKYNGRYKKQTVYIIYDFLDIFKTIQNVYYDAVSNYWNENYIFRWLPHNGYTKWCVSRVVFMTHDYSNDPRSPPKPRSATVMLPIRGAVRSRITRDKRPGGGSEHNSVVLKDKQCPTDTSYYIVVKTQALLIKCYTTIFLKNIF